MKKDNLPRNKEGKKMYPVCSWERNQHKVYNAHERVVVALMREPRNEELSAWAEKVERAYDAFDAHVRDGLVYATWEDSNAIKDIIYGYDARH